MKSMKRIAAVALVAGLSCLATAADFSAWGRKAEITFSGYEGTETLTNFPALVVLGPGTITGFAYDDSPDGGADLRFSDSTGLVELPYEIEQWNPAGKSYVWVRIPELVDANTSIWAYWNRAGQTAPDYTTNGAVWANGFQAVWHLGESGSTRNDATAHGNTGSLVGNTSSLSGGAVAGASEFDGAGDYINDGALAAINGSSRLTVSGWVNLTTLGVADNNDDSCLFSRGPGSPAILLWYNVNQDGTDQNHVYTFHVGNTSTLADRINGNKGLAKAGQWQHVVGVMNGGARKLYVDGRWDKTTSGGATAVPADTSSLRLGSWSQGTTMDFKGGMDEVRISNVERSAVWIMSEYLTVASNTVFQTYGAAQSAAPGMPSAATGIATNIAASSAWLCGSLTSTGASDTAVVAYWGAADGGTNAASWTSSAMLVAPQVPGGFSIQATELSADATYYYRVAASNDAGVAWSYSGGNFITGELTLTNTSNAAEATLTPGVFTVSRPGTATNEALTVAYAKTDGTALSGVDFAPLSGSATIPAGATTATITVTPRKNYSSMDDKTLTLSLTAAQAILGSNTNATMTIVNEGLPGGATNAWVRSGADAKASTAANWSLGHAPTNQNACILLGPYASAPDMTWDLTNAVAGWVQTAEYTGTVTILTKYPGQGDFTNLVITGGCTIDGGIVTHLANAGVDTATDRLALTIQGDLRIGPAGRISADEKGYAAGRGPGCAFTTSQNGHGASHGGLGGAGYKYTYSASILMPLPTYGSFLEPVTLGSGGNMRGGGAVLVKVDGTTRLDGAVTATAQLGSGRYPGAAGGSIYLTTGSLEGTGAITAAGRRGTDSTDASGGGGGGRIAVVLEAGDSFGNVVVSAPGGGEATKSPGAAGTVYLQTQDQPKGEGVLIIDNAPHAISPYFLIGTLMPEPTDYNEAPDLSHLTSVVVTNQGRLILNTSTVFDFGANNLLTSGFGDSAVVVAGANGISFPAEFTVSGDYQLLINTTVHAVGNWTVPAGAVLSHFMNDQQELYRLGVILEGNLTVEAGGSINVDGMGYRSALAYKTEVIYPGPAPGGMTGGYGAGHGGMGGGGYAGVAAKPTYGSVTAPTAIGSGAGSHGSGAIFLDIRGTTTVNGTITSRLTDNTVKSAGSSGGSIWLTTRHLAGSGLIDASGKPSSYSGSGGESSGGGGGGGRIAVVVTEGNTLDGVQLKASGGPNTSAGWAHQSGAAGTIYTQTANQEGRGRLLIANDNWDMGLGVATNTLTLLPAPTGALDDELKLATLVVSNLSYVALTENLTVGDLYVATNAANRLFLKGHTLKVDTYRHPDWGDEAWVVYDGGEIIWQGGTVLTIR